MRFERAWSLVLALAAALVLAGTPALAQSGDAAKQRAKELFTKGKTQYDLGNFQDAVKLFKNAYETSPHPAFLFNIAQAYRQMGDCKEALFFYKRYLTVQENEAKNQELVEARIKELNETCKANEAIKNKEPLGAMEPTDKNDLDGDDDVGRRGADAEDDDEDDDDGGDASIGVRRSVGMGRAPAKLSGTVEVGPALLQLGELQVQGAQFSGAASGGYALHFGAVDVDVGGRLGYVSMSWENRQLMVSGVSSLVTILANVTARYRAAPKIALRGELSAGMLVLTGLKEGHIFLNAGDSVSGVLTRPNVRTGVGGEYLFTDNVAGILSAVYSYSPAGQDLNPQLTGLAHIDVLVGVGWRL